MPMRRVSVIGDWRFLNPRANNWDPFLPVFVSIHTLSYQPVPFDPELALRGMWNLPERLAGDTRPMIESMIKLYLMLSGNMNIQVDDVLNYGCWCQIGQTNDAFATRGGKPVDKFDRHCQNWARCYRCAVIDSDNQVARADMLEYSTLQVYMN